VDPNNPTRRILPAFDRSAAAPPTRLDVLVGDDDRFQLEHRIVHAWLLLFAVFGLFCVPMNLFLGLGDGSVIFALGFSILHFVLYCAFRWLDALPRLRVPSLLLGTVAVGIYWFEWAGSEGPGPYFLMVSALVPVLASRGRHRLAMALLSVGVCLGLFGVDILAPELVSHPYVDDRARQLDRAFSHALTLGVMAAMGTVLVSGYRGAMQRAAEERSRAELLLHAMLPSTIARRLAETGERVADHHPDVTVLFADVSGFTPLAARMEASDLVARLDTLFTAFDAICSHRGVEKIKTIGDAYMAVSGLTQTPSGHALAAVLAARDMVLWLERHPLLLPGARLRAGVHSGPVVAGVVGARRFGYDIWGDTVNTASRMESHGKPGRVQISAETRDRLGGRVALKRRGVVQVKGKGPMTTWWVVDERVLTMDAGADRPHLGRASAWPSSETRP
jgi:class 3 adenylate cyclase